MSRRIVSATLQKADGSSGGQLSSFFDRVTTYVPADVVSAWIAVKGVVQAANSNSKSLILWVCFGAGLVLTALWTLKQTAEPNKGPAVTQTIVSTISFAVWVFALGEPFTSWLGTGPQSLYSSLFLIFYTLIVGLITPKDGSPRPTPAASPMGPIKNGG